MCTLGYTYIIMLESSKNIIGGYIRSFSIAARSIEQPTNLA